VHNGYEGFLSLEPHLGEFNGLAALEKSGVQLENRSTPEKFTLAYNALLDILQKELSL
jgi:hypothetical protein